MIVYAIRHHSQAPEISNARILQSCGTLCHACIRTQFVLKKNIEPLRLDKKSSLTLERKIARRLTSSLRCHRQVASQVSGSVSHRASAPQHQPETPPSVSISLRVFATQVRLTPSRFHHDCNTKFAPARIASLSHHCSRDHHAKFVRQRAAQYQGTRSASRIVPHNRDTAIGDQEHNCRVNSTNIFQQQSMNMSSDQP